MKQKTKGRVEERIRAAPDRGSLYLLTRRGNHDKLAVERMSLTRDLQDELCNEFARQAAAFDTDSKTLVPYQPFDSIDAEQMFKIKVSPPATPIEGEISFPDVLYSALTASDSAPILQGSPKLNSVRALAWVTDASRAEDAIVVFQAMERTQLLQHRFVLSIFGDDTYQRLKDSPMVLREESHAVYVDGFLLFSHEFYVKRFVDLSSVLIEATRDDIKDFFSSDCFDWNTPELTDDADQWTRRKIASISSRGVEIDPVKVKAAANAFGLDVTITGKGKSAKIEVPQERKLLKDLLRFLDEDYYTSWQGNQFQASAKRRVKP